MTTFDETPEPQAPVADSNNNNDGEHDDDADGVAEKLAKEERARHAAPPAPSEDCDEDEQSKGSFPASDPPASY